MLENQKNRIQQPIAWQGYTKSRTPPGEAIIPFPGLTKPFLFLASAQGPLGRRIRAMAGAKPHPSPSPSPSARE